MYGTLGSLCTCLLNWGKHFHLTQSVQGLKTRDDSDKEKYQSGKVEFGSLPLVFHDFQEHQAQFVYIVLHAVSIHMCFSC